MNALVVTFDQFPASILGCYGNEWIETPHLDRLAAGGLVADQCWAARIGPANADDAFSVKSCLENLKADRIRTRLFLEQGAQVDFSDAGFDALQVIAGERGPDAKPDRIPFAELVRAAQAAWHEEESGLFWLHGRGLEIPAEPPQGFAEIYQDEFEDRGVKWDSLSDDERRRHPSVSAGMVSLFDHWVGQLVAVIGGDRRPLLTIFCAAQGTPWQPLPHSFGVWDELRSPSVHVPLIVHVGGDDMPAFPAGLRNSQFLSTADLGPLVSQWFRGETPWFDVFAQQSARHSGRIVTTTSTGARRISTADWGAIFPAEQKPLLFRKPEDYWEVNDVADSLPGVIEEFLSGGRKPPDCA
jgi:hypothetical protein